MRVKQEIMEICGFIDGTQAPEIYHSLDWVSKSFRNRVSVCVFVSKLLHQNHGAVIPSQPEAGRAGPADARVSGQNPVC